MVDRAVVEKVFQKEVGETCFLFSPEPGGISILLLGLGAERKCTLETLRRAFGSLARRLHLREGLGELVFCLDAPSISLRLSKLGWEASAQAITLGWGLGSYRYDVYKTSPK